PDNQTLLNSPADWISPGGSVPGSDYVVADGSKVIIDDTDHIHPPDRVVWVWESLTRGMNPIILNDPTDPENDGTWTDPLHLAGQLALGPSRMYAKRMNLSASVPHGELSSTGYALADEGSEYLVYQPGSTSFTVTLAAGTYSYEWFNPDPSSN